MELHVLPSFRVFANIILFICVILSNGIVSFSTNQTSSSVENGRQKELQFISSNTNKQDDFSVFESSKVSKLVSTENLTESQKLDTLFKNDPCANFSTCSFIAQTKTKFCNCDEECTHFNDCCNGINFQNATHVVDDYNLRYECVQSNKNSLFDGVYVIAKCPETTNSADSSLCKVNNLIEVGPWVADEPGRLYKNRHCALCNGVSVLTVLDVKITNVNGEILRVKFENLTTHEKLVALYYDKYTSVKYVIPPEVKQRYCLPTEISVATSQCLKYGISPVDVDMITYRNIYCAPSKYTYTFCLGPGIDFSHGFGYGFDSMHPLTVLFSFQQSNDACQTQINGLCESEETYTNARVEIRFSVLANDTIEPDAFRQIAISMVLSTVVPNITYLDYLYAHKNGENSSTLPLVIVIMFIKSEMTLDEYITFPQTLQNLKWKMFMKSGTTNKVIEMITDVSAQLSPSDNFNALYEIYDKDISSIIKESSLQSHRFLDNFPCANISINSFLNDSRHPHVLTIDNITCEDEQNEMKQNQAPNLVNENDEYITYITYTGTCMSVISLICSVVVCRRSGLSTSIPGSNLENLSVALILANLLFLTGIGARKYQTVCTVIGIVLHYLWLLVFSFMSISVIYLVYDVRRISISTTTNKRCCFCAKYFLTIAGLWLPLLFVIPALVLEFIFPTTQFSPNYGGAICFPTAYPANFLFVSGPIMFSVGLNIICITILTIYFNIKEGEASKIREGNYSQQIGIFLRLSVISGLFWITGTLSSVLQSEVLDYIFVVTCSLQGFLIAVANVTTKRVFRNKDKSSFRTSTRTLSRSSRILTRKPTGYPRKTIEKRRLSGKSSNSIVVASLS
ncbi:unnamed protein product [Mytilus coruscus]|uniref:G-protein coupled receptors family 2 profile 2 domain-containing protein n=1 Tax=Mytilus coruscus TaxID=42192 RepID=A0A6J8BKT6_MYTCO|nr:unnamed protein product [Mytilus coruscus]